MEVGLAIAEATKALLERRASPSTSARPLDVPGDAFVAIHADGNRTAGIRIQGASPWRDRTAAHRGWRTRRAPTAKRRT
jgi:hypothetical protein